MAHEHSAAGAWIEPEVSYVDPARRHCHLCGRPIARRYWSVLVAGEALAFCDPDHADRWIEGQADRESARIG